jgi:hypothetical protein
VHSLILRAVTGPDRKLDQFPEKNKTDGGSISFPTE